MRHRKNKRRKRFFNGDRSLEIVSKNITEVTRHTGIMGPLHYTAWKKASKQTMEELFLKGALSKEQVEKMREDGIDISTSALKGALSKLNLDNNADFMKFAALAKANPEAIHLMNEVQSANNAKSEKQKAAEKASEEELKLEEQLRALDLDSIEGMQALVEIQKANPKAMEILTRISAGS